MKTQQLSHVASHTIERCGRAAKNLIKAYRMGGERALGAAELGWLRMVGGADGTRLMRPLRANLMRTQRQLNAVTTKGLLTAAGGAETMVETLVELGTLGVERLATGAHRFDQAARVAAFERLSRAALPAAGALDTLVAKLEAGTAQVVRRATGARPAVRKARTAAPARRKGAATARKARAAVRKTARPV